MDILVLNGPNLNLLGLREPEIYGRESYDDLCRYITDCAEELGLSVDIRQSNHEGALVDAIQEARHWARGIVINPAAYTHTSVAILDALKAVNLPTVEVHLTDPEVRESFRKVSYVALAAEATCKGKGFLGYREALVYLKERGVGGRIDA